MNYIKYQKCFDIFQKQTGANTSGSAPSMSQADKAEEARLAAEMLGGDDFDDDKSDDEWKCVCGQLNKTEYECCSQCALPQVCVN